jgi:hypothetical protein
MNGNYEVLSPWAEVDPVPLRGISPRLTDLAGKTIGLYSNIKLASTPIQRVVEAKLKEKLPDLRFKHFKLNRASAEWDNPNKAEWMPEWEQWLTGVDAVIFAVGD